jgi:hypothetical protein
MLCENTGFKGPLAYIGARMFVVPLCGSLQYCFPTTTILTSPGQNNIFFVPFWMYIWFAIYTGIHFIGSVEFDFINACGSTGEFDY